MSRQEQSPAGTNFAILKKFSHPDRTAKGEPRAMVPLKRLETLWINTGTLCNIECASCYIASSPTNDALSYISVSQVNALLDEISRNNLGTREIGFTGGEPFMNGDLPAMLEQALIRGYRVLVLTNAMHPLQRPGTKKALLKLREHCQDRLTFRVSLDHYTRKLHDRERGSGSFDKALEGLDWLSQNGFGVAIAGRTMWQESEQQERQGYADLIARHNWQIDAHDPQQLVLFPEMDENADVTEITSNCWSILGIRPDSMMCATSRMAILRRGEKKPQIVPCTLIASERSFEMGQTLQEAAKADGGMFANGAVKLCHPHCARFCVLGGGSCSRP